MVIPDPVTPSANDPLFLASSDHPGMLLTNTPFNGTNFLGWSRTIKMALGAKLKLGFIDGNTTRPAKTDANFGRWTRCDYMVTCWILNSMVAELSEAFLYAQSALELWKELSERYGQSNGPLIYQVERDLSKVTQEYQESSSSSSSDRREAWGHWRKLKQPKLIVAPMYDASELPFRMLCRKYGAEAAYTPMLHSRTFAQSQKFRSREFTTCKEDRPLFVQFCGNDPDILLEAAYHVEPYCDYVDINLGCPQRIARTGNYGAFLMDDLPLVKSIVEKLATNLTVPVSCKIRKFPALQDTINYAKLLEDSGCSLIAVHGRTRDGRTRERADWDAIKSVKNAVKIPVLANGNIRHMDDVQSCLTNTGVEGVMSAESLLDNPALFAGFRSGEWVLDGDDGFEDGKLDRASLVVEYLKLCEQYPVGWKIIVSHMYGMLKKWFEVHPDIRDDFNIKRNLSFEYLYSLVDRLRERGVQFPLYLKKT